MRNALIRLALAQALVLVAVAASLCHADDFMYFKKKAAAAGGGSCSPTTGDELTEGFENLSGSSGYEANVGTWTQTGSTIDNQATLAGSPPSNSCTKGLGFSISNATTFAQWNRGSLITANTNIDVVFDIYISAVTFAGAFQRMKLFAIAADVNQGSASEIISVWDTAGTNGANMVIMACDALDGNCNSTKDPVVLNTWHTITVHHDATAASSSIKVDSGTARTYTRGAFGLQYIDFGGFDGSVGAGESIAYKIGYVRINTP